MSGLPAARRGCGQDGASGEQRMYRDATGLNIAIGQYKDDLAILHGCCCLIGDAYNRIF